MKSSDRKMLQELEHQLKMQKETGDYNEYPPFSPITEEYYRILKEKEAIMNNRNYKVVVQDARATKKEFYKQPIDNRKKYIDIPIFTPDVIFIGTNDNPKTHEYYKNSQYLVVETEDEEGHTLEYRADMKHVKMDRLNERMVLNIPADKTISVGFTMFQNPKEYKIITGQDLYDLVAGTKFAKNFFPGRNW